MASAEHEPITGVPRGVQGKKQSPWSGGQGKKPPEAEHFFCVVIRLEWCKAAMFLGLFMVMGAWPLEPPSVRPCVRGLGERRELPQWGPGRQSLLYALVSEKEKGRHV